MLIQLSRRDKSLTSDLFYMMWWLQLFPGQCLCLIFCAQLHWDHSTSPSAASWSQLWTGLKMCFYILGLEDTSLEKSFQTFKTGLISPLYSQSQVLVTSYSQDPIILSLGCDTCLILSRKEIPIGERHMNMLVCQSKHFSMFLYLKCLLK